MKQWKLDSASSALLMIVLGAVLFLMPGLALTTVLRLIGAVAAVIGGIRLAEFLRDRDRGAADDAAAGGALLAVIAGAVLLLMPKLVISVFPLVVGVLILLYGIAKLMQALEAKRGNAEGWQVRLVLAIVTIACGVFICADPFSAAASLFSMFSHSLLRLLHSLFLLFLRGGKNHENRLRQRKACKAVHECSADRFQ